METAAAEVEEAAVEASEAAAAIAEEVEEKSAVAEIRADSGSADPMKTTRTAPHRAAVIAEG